MKTEIGAYEAKTKLPELLRRVLEGQEFTITHRGKAVADLVASGKHPPRDKAAAVERFENFLRRNPVRSAVDIAALIREGRE